MTFHADDEVFFVPSKCTWLEVKDGGVKSGYQSFQVSPSNEDISFEMVVKTNPAIDCSQFQFFDALEEIEYEFILTDTVDFIHKKPELLISGIYQDESGTNQVYEFDGKQPVPSNLVIKVTLLAQHQRSLPIFQDIMMMFSLSWSNSKFNDQ